MRIGFTGPGGMGKTTTLNLVKVPVPTLLSHARSVFAARNLKEADQDAMTPAERWDLQKEIWNKRVNAELSNQHFISDRTLIDHLAYTVWRCSGGIPDSELESFMQQCARSLSSYFAVFYFPALDALRPSTHDGMRQISWTYVRAQDFIIRTLIADYVTTPSIPLFRVPMGTPQERAQFVCDKLCNLTGNPGYARL